MKKIPKEVSSSLRALQANGNWLRVLKWILESRDELRVLNDTAEGIQVNRNQGGLIELNEILRAAGNSDADLERSDQSESESGIGSIL